MCLYVKTNKQQCSAMLFAVKNSKTVLYLNNRMQSPDKTVICSLCSPFCSHSIPCSNMIAACVEPEELDEDERLARRRAYLEKEFGSVE